MVNEAVRIHWRPDCRGEMMAKRAERTRRIRYAMGDVVQIPLSDGRFAFGRVLNDAAIAVYAIVSRETKPVEEVVGSEIAFCVGVFDTAIRDGSWPIIGSCAFQNDEDSWPPPTFVQDVIDPRKYSICEKGEVRPASAKEVRGLEPAQIYKPEHLVERIEEELCG
jgi:hypothetical protein